MFPADPGLVAPIGIRDRTMQALTELIDLNRILLNLARSRESGHILGHARCAV
jgi:hypothetical protein